MKIEGKIHKTKNWWAVEVPLLLINSQGKTKKEALAMIKDAIEVTMDEPGVKIAIEADGAPNSSFYVTSNKINKLIGFMLRQNRLANGITYEKIASRLKVSSPTDFRRYESGQIDHPSLDKVEKYLKLLVPNAENILKVS